MPEMCVYCYENPVGTDYGACTECDEYFDENPSGPGILIGNTYYDPKHKDYEWAVSQLALGPVGVIK